MLEQGLQRWVRDPKSGILGTGSVGMGMSRSLPGAGSHLSQVCRAGPCPEPKHCPTCRICCPSVSSCCGPKPSLVLNKGAGPGSSPAGAAHPLCPLPKLPPGDTRSWVRSPVGGKSRLHRDRGSHTAPEGPPSLPQFQEDKPQHGAPAHPQHFGGTVWWQLWGLGES